MRGEEDVFSGKKQIQTAGRFGGSLYFYLTKKPCRQKDAARNIRASAPEIKMERKKKEDGAPKDDESGKTGDRKI